MKRRGIILSLILILAIITAGQVFAAGSLSLEKSYPKDGGKDAAIENFGVKLYFNGEFTEKELAKANVKNIKLYGPDGKELPLRLLYPAKEKGVVLALLDTSKKDADGKNVIALSNSAYKIVISDSFRDNSGNTLGKETVISFSTLNQSVNTLVYFGMTILMFVGIGFVTIRGNKKKEAESQESRHDDKVNPYKEAKRTGKSVEEIIEKDRKEKAKRAEKEARKAAKEAAEDYDDEDYLEEGHYRVGRPRTVASAGSSYITGRKALAEKKAEEARLRKEQEAKWAAAKKGKKKR